MFEQQNIESKHKNDTLVPVSFDNALQLLQNMENGGDDIRKSEDNKSDTSVQAQELTYEEQMENELAKLKEDKQKEIDQVISETTNSLNHDVLQYNIA